MFTKFNRVLLASGLVLTSLVGFTSGAFADPEGGDDGSIDGDMPVTRTVDWTPGGTHDNLGLTLNGSLTDAALGSVAYTNSGPTWEIAIHSTNAGKLKNGTNEIAYQVKLACSPGTSANYVTPGDAVGTAATLCTGNTVFANGSAAFTLNISNAADNTVKPAGNYADTLYLVIKAGS